MSVLVKGMEMPKNCYQCRMVDSCQCLWKPYDLDDYSDLQNMVEEGFTRANNCPLVEIPPHGRLIDADEISEHKYATLPPYRKEYADGKPKSEEEVIAFKFGWNNAIDAITENAPTVIEAEEGE